MKHPQPIVSVIIPTYNNANLILASINSVLQQDYEFIECVVIDDGSTDNTYNILTPLLESLSIKYFKTENKGVSAARNYGIRVSGGEYVIFLDADDILLNDAVKNMVNSIADSDADMCVALEKGKSLSKAFPYQNSDLANLIASWWPVSSVLSKKNDLQWNEERKTWEVIEYFASLLMNDFKCVVCPKEVTAINHVFRKDRTTVLYDHYNPETTFSFFNELKTTIIIKNKANHQVLESIDKQLLNNLYQVYITKKSFPPNLNNDTINSKKISSYNWFKPFGISGFCWLFGIKNGIKLFYKINYYLKRT